MSLPPTGPAPSWFRRRNSQPPSAGGSAPPRILTPHRHPRSLSPKRAPAKHAHKRTSEDQLKRMLQLVPFLVHNQGLHISDVAAQFGIARKELEDDLRILICSGLPEGLPG